MAPASSAQKSSFVTGVVALLREENVEKLVTRLLRPTHAQVLRLPHLVVAPVAAPRVL